MSIPRSTFYYEPENDLEKEQKSVLLDRLIKETKKEYPFYGQRRIYRYIRKIGYTFNHKVVENRVRQLGLQCKVKRRFKITTNSKHGFRRYPNLIKGIVPTTANQIWVCDITYIDLGSFFVYLAIVIDRFTREVVGYNLGVSIDTGLCMTALKMAISRNKPGAGCIHHSDQGVQYASKEYVDILLKNQFQISMSRRGNPYDNAFAESFMKTIKVECIYLNSFKTVGEIANNVPYFIEQVYNKKRLHSSLDYMSPEEFKKSKLDKVAA